MSREEAAADAVYGQNYGWQFNMTEAEGVAEAALAAADAWDAANGVHRVSLDDATVQRVAHALAVTEGWNGHDRIPERYQKHFHEQARAVLAAALEGEA